MSEGRIKVPHCLGIITTFQERRSVMFSSRRWDIYYLEIKYSVQEIVEVVSTYII